MLALRHHRPALFFSRRSASVITAAAAMSSSSSSSFYDAAVAKPGARLAETEVVVSGADAPANAATAPRLRVFASESAASKATDPAAQLAAALGFKARPGEVFYVPAAANSPISALFLGLGATRGERLRAFAAASAKAQQALPSGRPESVVWELEDEGEEVIEDATLGWRLGSYVFDQFKSSPATTADNAKKPPARLLIALKNASSSSPFHQAVERAHTLGALYCWARDLTNAPAGDLGPDQLAAEAALLALAHGPQARLSLIRGDDLLAKGWPLVHAVGRASSRPPVLVDLAWQPSGAAAAASSSSSPSTALPLLVLCGKGVCFDTGGLSLKTSAGMRLMKKDMGGGALVLALAGLIMRSNLPVRLRVLVPCVENSVSGDANRLGDVLRSRLGLTVEQLNTDAEGRLILADALAEACGPDCAAPFGGQQNESEEARQRRWRGEGAGAVSASSRPDLVIDVATLTGAARVALGPELPAVFTNDDATWAALKAAAAAEGDPLWRLPLHAPYNRMLDSKVADLSNVAGGDASGQAGAVVAALFLERFVRGAAAAASAAAASGGDEQGAETSAPPPPWVHVDTAGWLFGGSAGPGRPEGGEPLALRALWRMLKGRYGGGGGK